MPIKTMPKNTKQLIVFVKAPIAGQCKTRLAPLLGKHKARAFYITLVNHCFAQIRNIPGVDIALYATPDTRHPFIQQLATDTACTLNAQQGEGLGERMFNAIHASLHHYSQSVLIGTDCPVISPSYIEQAFTALQHTDIVLGPADDGGYVLIGAKRVQFELFQNIHWSSNKVLKQSLHNCQTYAYNTHLLETLWDVDTPADFRKYQHYIQEQTMDQQQADKIRNNVRDSYSKVAKADNEGDSCGVASSCCGVSDDDRINQLISTRLGYSEADLQNVPEGADMGLGCGNPKAIAALQPGETVVDLGSGGGFDAFLAASEVGDTGQVIGVDMTPEMISKARNNASKAGFRHVEFRLGEIEHLPIADNTIDTIMSNCVINLSPDKQQVFNEAWRILKPGGRLAISDVVSSSELPDDIKNDTQLYSACVSGASSVDELSQLMKTAGFKDIKIEPKDESREFIKDWAPGSKIEDFVVSASIQAIKPF
ncbi:Arsenite methyltransferase [hydrothermal vent metagenome]|uniref:Arsenite methyltransferase n=1 Tax=hydrothermal vent metagenome TaxID=652676 RepID=A0A3B0XWI9_9ZZZZ